MAAVELRLQNRDDTIYIDDSDYAKNLTLLKLLLLKNPNGIVRDEKNHTITVNPKYISSPLVSQFLTSLMGPFLNDEFACMKIVSNVWARRTLGIARKLASAKDNGDYKSAKEYQAIIDSYNSFASYVDVFANEETGRLDDKVMEALDTKILGGESFVLPDFLYFFSTATKFNDKTSYNELKAFTDEFADSLHTSCLANNFISEKPHYRDGK